jgi:hypothetical protein
MKSAALLSRRGPLLVASYAAHDVPRDFPMDKSHKVIFIGGFDVQNVGFS